VTRRGGKPLRLRVGPACLPASGGGMDVAFAAIAVGGGFSAHGIASPRSSPRTRDRGASATTAAHPRRHLHRDGRGLPGGLAIAPASGGARPTGQGRTRPSPARGARGQRALLQPSGPRLEDPRPVFRRPRRAGSSSRGPRRVRALLPCGARVQARWRGHAVRPLRAQLRGRQSRGGDERLCAQERVGHGRRRAAGDPRGCVARGRQVLLSREVPVPNPLRALAVAGREHQVEIDLPYRGRTVTTSTRCRRERRSRHETCWRPVCEPTSWPVRTPRGPRQLSDPAGPRPSDEVQPCLLA